MIIKTRTHVSTKFIKYVNIQAHEHLNLKVHLHLTVELPSNLTIIIKACMCPSIQLHEPFGVQKYRYILDQVYSHAVKK